MLNKNQGYARERIFPLFTIRKGFKNMKENILLNEDKFGDIRVSAKDQVQVTVFVYGCLCTNQEPRHSRGKK